MRSCSESVSPIVRWISGAKIAITRIISLGFLLALVSCGNHGDWVGTWEGSHGLPPKEGDHPGVVVTMNKVKLQVDKNGKFVLIEAGLPRSGIIAMGGEGATLTVKTKMGVDILPTRPEPTIKLRKVSADELELNDPGAFVRTPVKLRRETRPN